MHHASHTTMRRIALFIIVASLLSIGMNVLSML